MHSVGNDVVAFSAINRERSNDSRFYGKILSVSEQAMYHQPEFSGVSFELFLWLAWSVKESAFKYFKRLIPDLVFAPSRISIQHLDIDVDRTTTGFSDRQWEGHATDESCCRGNCSIGSTTLYFRSKLHHDMIATVVDEDESFSNTWWGVRRIDSADPEVQSREVRAFLLHRLNTVLADDDLRTEKSPAGYPIVFQGGKELKLPVSLAHHERFIAYAFSFRFS